MGPLLLLLLLLLLLQVKPETIYIIIKFCRLWLRYLTPPFTSIKGVAKPSFI